jgi:hypothetical protein
MYKVIIILIILLIVLITVLLSLGKESTFGSVSYKETVIDSIQASTHNAPNIKISYKTPDKYLGRATDTYTLPESIRFTKYPLFYLIEGSSGPVKPSVDDLLSETNLINLNALFGNTALINSGDNTLISNQVELVIPGLKEIIKVPLVVGNTYYLGIAIMSTLQSYLKPGRDVITGRYGKFKYKNLTFTEQNLLEIDPDELTFDLGEFGQLAI